MGRFVVLGKLGEGGSGEVFSAFDPVLDRKVAVKLLRGDGHVGAALVREGRMLAKLSDPRVVTIHDFSVHDGQAFLAMELLEGRSFETWCAERRAEGRWREIVAALRDVGLGLAAAHAAGIVHGDVKPSNVLVDGSGRVKVSDFGIARLSSETRGYGRDAERIPGTPAFMSPEQHDGLPPDERSDQYSFCLLAWTALTGELPFDARSVEPSDEIAGDRTLPTLEALASAKRRPFDPKPTPAVPRRLVNALERGLKVDPAERWRSMVELIEHLTVQAPIPNWALGSGAVVGLGVVSLAMRAIDEPTSICDGAEQHLVGVWDDSTRGTVEQQFAGVGTTLAGDTWPIVRDRLDRYAEQWVAIHRSACEATSVRKERSEAALDLQMGCLHRGKVALAMAARVLSSADASVVELAPRVAGGLPPLSRCEDLDALRTDLPRPTDPEAAAAVDSATERLAEVRTLMGAGRDEDAMRLVQELRSEVADLDYPPARIEAALLAAHLFVSESDIERGAELASESLDEALAVGAWTYAAESSELLTIVADRKEQRDAASIYARLSRALADRPEAGSKLRSRAAHAQAVAEHVNGRYEAALERELEAIEHASAAASDPADPELAQLRSNLANRYTQLGRFEEGERAARTAAVVLEATYGPRHPQTLHARSKIGMLLARSGKLAEAEPVLRDVLRLTLQTRPPEHPDVGLVRDTLGNVLSMMGRAAEAQEQFELELAALRNTSDPDSIAIAGTLSNLAGAQLAQGRFDEAERAYRQALEAAQKRLAPDHPKLAGFHGNLGNVLVHLGRHDEARRQLEQAIAIIDRAHGPDHLLSAGHRFGLGSLLGVMKEFDPALEHIQRAIEIRQAHLTDDHPDLARCRLGKALLLLELGRKDEARPLAAAAWTVYRDQQLPSHVRAEAAFAMARVSDDRSEAFAFAQQAKTWLTEAGPVGAAAMAEVKAWLRKHGDGSSHPR